MTDSTFIFQLTGQSARKQPRSWTDVSEELLHPGSREQRQCFAERLAGRVPADKEFAQALRESRPMAKRRGKPTRVSEDAAFAAMCGRVDTVITRHLAESVLGRLKTIDPRPKYLRESITFSGKPAKSENIIRNVRVLSWESKNQRRYAPESVDPAQYAGVAVYLNHPSANVNESRRVQDKFGWLVNPRRDGRGIVADLAFNPTHPYAKQFQWLVKNRPEHVGLSHDALGVGETREGIFHVKRVIRVKSVDLVADPATTAGLFEAAAA